MKIDTTPVYCKDHCEHKKICVANVHFDSSTHKLDRKKPHLSMKNYVGSCLTHDLPHCYEIHCRDFIQMKERIEK